MKELLTSKELAHTLKKSPGYIKAMRKCGFKMPGKVATLDAALDFLEDVPNPTVRAKRFRKSD